MSKYRKLLREGYFMACPRCGCADLDVRGNLLICKRCGNSAEKGEWADPDMYIDDEEDEDKKDSSKDKFNESRLIKRVLREELQKANARGTKSAKPKVNESSEEHWTEFGSWHNKYPKGTNFSYDGRRWNASNKELTKEGRRARMISEIGNPDERYDAEWQRNFDEFMNFLEKGRYDMEDYDDIMDIADTEYYLLDNDEAEATVKKAVKKYLTRNDFSELS